MKNSWKEVFHFNRGERNGMLVLFSIILLIFIVPWMIGLFAKPEERDFTVFEQEALAFLGDTMNRAKQDKRYEEIDFDNVDRSVASSKLTPFPFNPNNLDASEWKKLGLTDKQVRTIKNFEAKGGKFYKKEDLAKIYSISGSEYDVLAPYIVIPAKETKTRDSAAARPGYKPGKADLVVDLNIADSVTLLNLRGIGPAFAHRIIRYRELLGGFYSVDQLREVYGFDEEKFSMVAPQCSVASGVTRKISLNEAGVAELKKHPYFTYDLAKAIVDHRIVKGKFTSLDQLKEIPQMQEERFVKVASYLRL